MKSNLENKFVKPSRFILIDDDHVSNIVSKYGIIRDHAGADIQVYTDAELALAAIQNQDPVNQTEARTVVLLDINMPLMSGWDFLEKFSKLQEDISKSFIIFMLSSSLDKGDLQRAKDSILLSGYLSKPLNPTHLKEAIASLT